MNFIDYSQANIFIFVQHVSGMERNAERVTSDMKKMKHTQLKSHISKRLSIQEHVPNKDPIICSVLIIFDPIICSGSQFSILIMVIEEYPLR